MATVPLLRCPPEIRQHMLSYLLPDEVSTTGPNPKVSAVLYLVLTCKAIRRDVLELMPSWFPTFRFDRPSDIAAFNHESAGSSTIRTIRLRVFADVGLDAVHNPVAYVFADTPPWIDQVERLPKASVKTVIIDITPAPMWMISKRPNWVRSAVMDRRCALFLDSYVETISQWLDALRQWYGDTVCLELGGQVGWKSRQPIQRIMTESYRANYHHHHHAMAFTGEFLRGEKRNPVRLSLNHTCTRWGMLISEQEEGRDESRRRRDVYQDFHYLVHHRQCPERPALDLEVLGRVAWSEKSAACYYAQMLDDERETLKILVQLLTFAVASKKTEGGGAQRPSSLDFPPAARRKRKLVHSLAQDLGLTTESVGDVSEKFVRLSELP